MAGNFKTDVRIQPGRVGVVETCPHDFLVCIELIEPEMHIDCLSFLRKLQSCNSTDLLRDDAILRPPPFDPFLCCQRKINGLGFGIDLYLLNDIHRPLPFSVYESNRRRARQCRIKERMPGSFTDRKCTENWSVGQTGRLSVQPSVNSCRICELTCHRLYISCFSSTLR
jgi:hypothetical protein